MPVITSNDNPVEWALLVHDLDDAREHLVDLLAASNSPDFDETEFGIQLAHIYSHLNRAWNGRTHAGNRSDADFQRFSEFPKDLHTLSGQSLPSTSYSR